MSTKKFEISKNSFKQKIKDALDNKKTLMVMTIASVYALILSDLNIIFFSKGAIDIIFTIISTIVFFLFLIEFILSSIVKDNYNLTFFFWMDLFSMLSMLINIEWIVSATINLIFGKFMIFTSPSMYRLMKSLSGAVRTSR